MKVEIPVGQAHRLLAPRPACLLTTRYRGQVNVMAISWVCPISLEPPMVAMAVHPGTYTHDMLRRSEEAVLNVPGRPLAEQVLTCGDSSGQDVDKIAKTGLLLDSGRRVEAPWIADCLAHVECAIVGVLSPGDHSVFLAEILGAWAEEAAFEGMWKAPEDNEELNPLQHLGGRRFCLLGKVIEP